MEITLNTTRHFRQRLKQLAKKHKSLQEDLKEFTVWLKVHHQEGVDLGEGIWKYRLAITSKGRGKSGGARVITLNVFKDNDCTMTLIEIYDKAERSSIGRHEILRLLIDSGLLV